MDERFQVEGWKLDLVQKYFKGNLKMVANEMETIENQANEESIEEGSVEVENVEQEKEERLEDDVKEENVEKSSKDEDLKDAQDPNQDQDEDKDKEDDQSTSETSPILSIKPRLVTNKRQFPIKDMVASPDDQGSNCCVIIIKSKKTDLRIVRHRSILVKKKAVQKVLDKFKEDIFKTMTYHKDIRAVYNLIFHKSAKARKFFSAVNDILLQEVPKMASVYLCHQQFLGYDCDPVLSEEEMLNIHSPEVYSNVFRTTIPLTIVEKEGSLRFVFREVIQLNTFIFDRCSNQKAKTLGELKRNLKPLILEPSQDGCYRLTTRDDYAEAKCSKISEKFKFTLESVPDHLVAKSLRFSNKLDMFKFLFDSEAMVIFDSIRIDRCHIVNKDDIKVVEKVETLGVVDHLESCELFDSQDSGLNESTATDISVLETSLALKDDEIKTLKSELSRKNATIERQRNQLKKIENKFYETESTMLKINQLVNPKTSKAILLTVKSSVMKRS